MLIHYIIYYHIDFQHNASSNLTRDQKKKRMFLLSTSVTKYNTINHFETRGTPFIPVNGLLD